MKRRQSSINIIGLIVFLPIISMLFALQLTFLILRLLLPLIIFSVGLLLALALGSISGIAALIAYGFKATVEAQESQQQIMRNKVRALKSAQRAQQPYLSAKSSSAPTPAAPMATNSTAEEREIITALRGLGFTADEAKQRLGLSTATQPFEERIAVALRGDQKS